HFASAVSALVSLALLSIRRGVVRVTGMPQRAGRVPAGGLRSSELLAQRCAVLCGPFDNARIVAPAGLLEPRALTRRQPVVDKEDGVLDRHERRRPIAPVRVLRERLYGRLSGVERGRRLVADEG